MIYLIITACSILYGGTCREDVQAIPAESVTPYACMHYGQLSVVTWQREHPNWSVRKWKCVPEGRLEARA